MTNKPVLAIKRAAPVATPVEKIEIEDRWGGNGLFVVRPNTCSDEFVIETKDDATWTTMSREEFTQFVEACKELLEQPRE